MGPKSRYVFAALLVLVSLMTFAVLAQGGPPTPAASADDLAGIQTQAATIHCCGEGAADACRTECKAMGPGCKGQLGCRAGECVCNCSCP